MFPIALDLSRIPILLIGRGEMLEKRRKQLEEAGAKHLTVHILPPSPCGKGQGEGVSLESRYPPSLTLPHKGGGEIPMVIMATGLSQEESEKVAKSARAAGKLVNVEDVMQLCDFYFTANVTRGDLVIAVSTSGASPTLARKIRDRIAELFGEEWASHLREISNLRQQWKSEGKAMKEVLAESEEHIKKRGWL